MYLPDIKLSSYQAAEGSYHPTISGFDHYRSKWIRAEDLGTVIIFKKSKVLGEEKKQLEVAVIEGVDGNKEILVSLKLMKAWKMVHKTFPRERVDDYMNRINEANKYDENYVLYYSIETNTSQGKRS